jgi:large conductance mechanosensitive channel
MAAKKPATKKMSKTKMTKSADVKAKGEKSARISASANTTQATKATRAALQEEAKRVEKAESKIKRLESQVDRLKALDKVGVHKQFSGFMSFLREQSVVGLAIGLVLGTQAKVLVDQLIASFINPIVGLLLPGEGTLKDKVFTVHLSGKTAEFGWGAFVLSLLTFVIVAAVVYYVFKGLKLDKLDKKKED